MYVIMSPGRYVQQNHTENGIKTGFFALKSGLFLMRKRPTFG